MNAEPKEPRKRPRLIWLILVDLLAAWLPWILFFFAFFFLYGPDDFVEESEGRPLLYLLLPAFSPAFVLGIRFHGLPGSGQIVFWCTILACQLGVLVFLQRRFYRWFKYVAPAHLFLVSAIPAVEASGRYFVFFWQ